ncbi:PREDICTED: uncharacterized protein LOC104599740 [Nelumbo nucifera]|uniref:Uncharacterized protein LOC104599740 n=2 Tax=Nelumbo nucifera TaxID=4432 RepID=A0A1U8AEJ4_NELNU|nr:PREDICTED: uncharacterized protein LOC104599740 [Nelumbo nucifera]DAD44050.1 TPA_asm: hypothetical protein HUJ06_002280 [Nelumbo nucifera]
MIIERVVTVEYLEPSMSRELLGKFPDNSAFDFDYSQSELWSPLLPRGYSSISVATSMEVRRKLSDGFEKVAQEKIRKMSSKIKKKITTFKKKRCYDLGATPVKGSTPRKGWTRVLRAASKHFKKHKDPPSHIKLQNYLRNSEFS